MEEKTRLETKRKLLMTVDEVRQTKTGIEGCERGQQEGSCHWVGHLEGTWGASLTLSTAFWMGTSVRTQWEKQG